MGTFVVETPAGRRLTIEASDEAAALEGARRWHDENNGGYVQPAPPPGEIIHDAGRSYISDRPEISAERDPAADERGNAIEMQALRARGQLGDDTASTIARVGQPFAQGYSFGLGDELVSAIFGGARALAGGNFSNDFDYAQAFQRQELERQREEAPLASLGMELGGGLSSGMGLAKGGLTLSGRVANTGLRSLPARVGAGAAEGTGFGALSGFGSADGDVKQRASEMSDDALIGAVFGAGAVPVVDIVSTVLGRPVANAVGAWRAPDKRANDLLVEAIMRDRTTPAAIADRVATAAGAGQPEFAAIDAAGRNTQRLGAMAAKTPGPFRDTAVNTVAARQQGQGDRIGGYVDEALGAIGPGAYATEQGILQGRRAAAEPLYAAAYRAPTPDGAFYTDMLSRQSVRDALRAAERTAAERQVPITDLFEDVPNPAPTTRQVPTSMLGADGRPIMRSEVVDPTIRVPTVRGWGFIKRELDARVNQLYSTGDTTAAEAIKETRNALREQLGRDVPDYGRALAKYADDSAALDAIETGRELMRSRNADETRQAYASIDPSQRDLAKIGAARETGVRLENARAGQDKTLLFDTPAMQGKLDTLIDEPAARAQLDARLDRERAMVRSNRQLLGGSSTYENFMDGGAVSDGVMAKLAQGRVGSAAMEAAGRMLGFVGRSAQGMSPDVADRVGSYLMSADPVQIRQLSQAFDAAAGNGNAEGRFVSALIAAASAPGRTQNRE